MNGHLEDRLVALLGGELDPAERREVEAHLAGCAACRAARADYERLAADLAREAAPPLHWGAYRAELRDKLEGRRPRAARRTTWSLRPASLALAAGLVAVMVWVGTPGPGGRNGDPLAMEDALLASRLELIARLDLVESLDLLEDLDVIGRLDGPGPRGEG